MRTTNKPLNPPNCNETFIQLTADGAYTYVSNTSLQVEDFLYRILVYQDLSLRYVPGYTGPISFSCYDRKLKRFFTGLLPQVCTALSEQGYLYKVNYLPPVLKPDRTDLPDWLYNHQVQIIKTMWSKVRGIICAPTGSGKTIALVYYVRGFSNARILVTVPSATLMDKTVAELEKAIPEPIGQVGDGKKTWRRITVGLVRSLINYKDQLKTIDICIRDEAHCSSCESHAHLASLMPNLSASWGVTATPWRSDGKDLIMYGVLGPQQLEITPEELRSRNVILQPSYYQIPVAAQSIHKKYGRPPLDEVYNKCLVQNRGRNELIVELALTYLKSPNRNGPLLILVKSIDHGNLLSTMFAYEGWDIPFASGNTPSEQRLEWLEKLRSNQMPALIASSIFNEGEDIKPLSVLILASGGGNERIFTQQIGRVLRTSPNKTKAVIIDFQDHEEHYLAYHSRKRMNYLNALYPGCGRVISAKEALELLNKF